MSSSIALISKSLSFLFEQDVGNFLFFYTGKVHVQAWDVWQFLGRTLTEWNYEWKVINIL